jgi:protein-disulfide isomerase
MTPRERHEWSAVVSRALAPCPNVAVSIAQCVRENRSCGGCLMAAKWVASAVHEGASEDQIEHAYKERFDPATVKVLPVDGSPTKGPDDAPVTIVEFADFECPHCRLAVPVVDAVLEAHPGKVRVVYKSFTLSFHLRGEPAARAAFAAGAQGKFWEMEHLLFERQQNLEDSDLDRYAKALKLDLAQWKTDMSSPAVNDRIAHDHALGDSLKLKGTPTIYVNGRELDVEGDEQLEARVAGELGVAPAPITSADNASAKPLPVSAPPTPPKHP